MSAYRMTASDEAYGVETEFEWVDDGLWTDEMVVTFVDKNGSVSLWPSV